MHPTTTIRTELEGFLRRKGLNFSQLGREAGLNPGTVSSIINGNRVMAVDQLDRMTAVLGLPQGYYYEQYIQESMVDTVPDWRRIKPFLYRCAELDKLDCIRQIVMLLLDNLIYSPLLFEVAEDFFNEGRSEAAILLYESVATSERRQHSERLAFCHYRLFTLRLGENQEDNLLAALQFEPFVDRLDEIDQLDALRDLANTFRSMRRWDKVDKIAKDMGTKAKIQLINAQQDRRREEPTKKTKRPLFVYLALSNLFRGAVSDARGDHNEALEFNYTYADLSWVKEEDEETRYWVKMLEAWAQANIWVCKLFYGDSSVIKDYVAYIEQNRNETLTGLLNILTAANQFDYEVDDIIKKFENEILSYIQLSQPASVGVYSKEVITERADRLLFELAKYNLKKGLYVLGFSYLTNALHKSILLNNDSFILDCVRLFEKYREFSSIETQTEYWNLLKEEE
ncbi:helix-turn-helix domain-containing protein [Paenibacillus donghaensis]|uniref:Transcriptional regulator n=1 Tax=Paenibacillus donghaensis TaxID=414771 RepID=A0A2Z2KMG4_9BACL|nr:helix-turn-helix transcriptional regulator [Paenibacillus donghaensis]ASA25595.1 transcriptional regulator [Paenibacillus donghaensis]